MTQLMTHEFCFETFQGELEVDAEFDVTVEQIPAEPFSWGEGRGFEIETSAEFYSCNIGGLKINRAMLVKILSKSAVDDIENAAAEAFAEKLA